MAPPLIPPRFAAVMVAAIAIAAGLAYAILNITFIMDVWTAEGGVPSEPNAAAAYVSSALAGLVGGITALAFGISPPAKVTGLANAATAGRFDRSWVGALYVTVYFVVGLVAIATWIAADHPTEVIKNVATVTLGMVIPIVVGYFKQ